MIRTPRDASTAASIVDAMRAIANASPEERASFARGRCVRGTYIPSDRAEEITKSRSFTRPSRVLARFSADGGGPRVADTDNATLRGLGFRLGDAGHHSDILTQSAPIHYARTLDQMLSLLKAHMPGPDGKPDLKKLNAFCAANPETLHQANYMAAHPLPFSFAGTTYWAVHAFPATNSRGETQVIKFKVVPVSSNDLLAGHKAGTSSADILNGDLEKRIATGDIRFSLMALLGGPNDPTMDVTIRWPGEDTREAVRLGTIVITAIEASETCDASPFNPTNLADGVGHPPDEIFAARRAAYTTSQAQRR
jgi:catalase